MYFTETNVDLCKIMVYYYIRVIVQLISKNL